MNMVQYGVEDFLRDAEKPGNINILLGILFVLLGVAAILLPKFTTGIIIYTFGGLLFVSGILAIIAALKGKNVSNAGLYMGMVLFSVGILIFLFPVTAGHILTFILLLFLLGTGAIFFYWVYLLGLKESGYMPLLAGVVAIALSLLIILGWFGDVNPWLIGLFVGTDLLFNGIILLVLGIMRR